MFLRYHRRLHDETQVKVAKALGILQSSYSLYETGKTTTPLSVVRRLSERWGVSMEELSKEGEVRKGITLKKLKGVLENESFYRHD